MNSRILIIDNYDSFTYNLVHMIAEFGHSVHVVRNDKMELSHVNDYDRILLSPGPGVPNEAGIMNDVIRAYGPTKRILGICLGHQGIAEVYGATLYNLADVLHGVTSTIEVRDQADYLFTAVPARFTAIHYHSWTVQPGSLPSMLRVTAVNEAGLVMGLSHVHHDVKGLQFHPESILTQEGSTIIRNWLTQTSHETNA